MSVTRRSTEGILDFVSEQTNHTGSPLYCAMKKYRSVQLPWNTRRSPSIFLCFNTAISNSTRSTENNRFYGRKTDTSKSARSRHYLTNSARSRHYHLASDHNGMNQFSYYRIVQFWYVRELVTKKWAVLGTSGIPEMDISGIIPEVRLKSKTDLILFLFRGEK